MYWYFGQQVIENLAGSIARLKKINRHLRPVLITGKIKTPLEITLTLPDRPTKNDHAKNKTTRCTHGWFQNC